MQLARALGVAAATSLAIGTRVGAQQLPGRNPFSITADTGTAAEGARAGRDAAAEPSVGGRAVVGFLGGIPIGFFGPMLTQLGDPAGPIGVGGGLVILGVAWRLGDTQAPPVLSIDNRGEAYMRAYSKGYRDRLLERRGKAAVLGGVAGAITGFGLLFLLLSNLST